MSTKVEWSTPANTMAPLGPYSHIAKSGSLITIGATAGVDPSTGALVGPSVEEQTRQILEAFEIMLATVDSDLDHVMHIHVFLLDMADFGRMNDAYAAKMNGRMPPRTAVEVAALPKTDARVTMNLMAVARH